MWECYFYFKWAPQLTRTTLFLFFLLLLCILNLLSFILLSLCNFMTFCLARTLFLLHCLVYNEKLYNQNGLLTNS